MADDIAVGFARTASLASYAQNAIAIGQAVDAGADAFAFMIPVIGTILRLILYFVLRPAQPKGPFFGLALVLHKNTYPTVGNALIASQNFRSLAVNGGHDIPPEGAIVITEGGSPIAHEVVHDLLPKIEDLQRKMLYPFYTDISNLNIVFARAAVGAVVSPPLNFNSEYGDYYFTGSIPLEFDTYVLSRSASLDDAVHSGYTYLVQVINDAILRVAYISVLDAPIKIPMQGSINDSGGQLNVTPTQTTAPTSQVALPVPASQQVQVQLPEQVTSDQSAFKFSTIPLLIFGILWLAQK